MRTLHIHHFAEHIHRPHWEDIKQRMNHFVHNPAFWAVMAMIALLAILVLLALYGMAGTQSGDPYPPQMFHAFPYTM